MLYLMPYFKRLKIQLLLGILLIAGSVSAQQNFLEIPVKLDIEKGDLKEVVCKVKKDGKDAFTQSGASKMRFKLDFNKKYTLIFTKPGYITKTIEINTKAPTGRIASGFDPYKIGVKLFLQNQENMVIYNQPVAQIKFDQNLDDFNFQTDYSKSILSAVNHDDATEQTAVDSTQTASTSASTQSGTEPILNNESASTNTSNGDAQVQATASNAAELTPTTTTSTQNNEEQAPIGKTNNGDDVLPVTSINGGDENTGDSKSNMGSEIPPIAIVSGGDEAVKNATFTADKDAKGAGIKPNDGSENNTPKIAVNSSAEAPGEGPQFTESEHVTREDIVERNRIITKIKVNKNGVETEYSRVNYSWGGRYFFKNNVLSISETLFVQWTGVRN